VKAETWDQSSPHPTGTSRAAPDSLRLTFSQPCHCSQLRPSLEYDSSNRHNREVLEKAE
jgi:hypothetical protein